MYRHFLITFFLFVVTLTFPAGAEESTFHEGPLFKFAKIAPVESDLPLAKDTEFKVAFDVSKPSDPGSINRSLNSAARFMNMHIAAGVPKDNIKLALVIHGKASFDMTRNSRYAEQNIGKTNGNIDAIKALIDEGVEIYVCGQSAAYYRITKKDLLPGVKMALSAMTAHALLQQQDYTLNPF